MNPFDWKYIGEGNANIVVGYKGNTQDYIDMVLRIQKKGHSKNLTEQIHYQQKLACLVFGENYFLKSEVVTTSKEFLECLSGLISKDRPHHRKHNDVDVESKEILLSENLLVSSKCQVIAIELKPKWGFNPSVYSKACRFCIHNHVRNIHDYTKKSKFCPLDLFSSNRLQIQNALQCLFKTPQNNFRLFMDGSLIESGSRDFDKLTLSTLFPLVQSRDKLIDILVQIISETQVLQKLKTHQELLHYNVFDIAQILGSLYLNDSSLTLEKIDSIVKNENPELSPDEKIARFLISLTLKDLSLIMTIYPTATSSKNCQTLTLSNGQLIYFRVTPIDLDQKSIEKIDKWISLEKAILHAHATCETKDFNTCSVGRNEYSTRNS